MRWWSCILLNFYIKPQHRSCIRRILRVVSYWISTSNHNVSPRHEQAGTVVSYWISTSNHNTTSSFGTGTGLYLIEFLHQTTTFDCELCRTWRCILLNFYIKPQQRKTSAQFSTVVSYWISTSNHNYNVEYMDRLYVVSYWISTSNHNGEYRGHIINWLYLIEFLHQTTTISDRLPVLDGCILLNFYIKPQRSSTGRGRLRGCILLNFYIKPQQST